ncbi:MAG: hypothetical protein F7C35_01105 [Desulfurococcales archaeon]|nr:hypothetical protein [Desulfurococcales archaeon]
MRIPVEFSKSRSGKHASRKIAVAILEDGRGLILSKPVEEGDQSIKVYARGYAGFAATPPNTKYIVWFDLVRNLRGHIKGRVVVYNAKGEPLLELVLRRRKLRRVRGDPGLAPIVEKALKTIKLYDYIRRINLNTGA